MAANTPSTVVNDPSGAASAPQASASDLADAGAIGATDTVGSVAALPTTTTASIQTVVKAAASLAVSSASGDTTSSTDTQTAVAALAHGLTQLAETAAVAGGPVAEIAADVLAPSVATTLADAISALMTKIGIEVTTELKALTSWAKSA